MDVFKRKFGRVATPRPSSTAPSSPGTPQAPKTGTIPLPDLPNVAPPLVPSWSSSESSSSASPSPTTPSPRSSPTAYRAASKVSGWKGGHHEDLYDISRYSSPDPALEKDRLRRAPTPGPQIVKPKPWRPFEVPLSQTSITAMPVAVPTAAQDIQKPLKGILKPPRPATATPSASSASPPPSEHSGRPASSASRRPSHSEPLPLHWQLIHPSARSWQPLKYLHWDITKPISTIRIRDYSESPPKVFKWPGIKNDLAKEACNSPLYEMRIRYEKIPGLEIRVKGKGDATIRCEDIFEAIYECFDRVLTPDERCDYIPDSAQLKRVEAALLKRCAESHRAVSLAEQRKGIRVVDLLEGNTLFLGLKRSVTEGRHANKYWVVEFGPVPQQ